MNNPGDGNILKNEIMFELRVFAQLIRVWGQESNLSINNQESIDQILNEKGLVELYSAQDHQLQKPGATIPNILENIEILTEKLYQ